MSLLASAFLAFATVNAAEYQCATLYEHHRGSGSHDPSGGAQYNIIVGDLGETTNFNGWNSIDGFGKKSWWDDRVSGFKVQSNCKLELWCEPDKWPTHYAPHKMGGWCGPYSTNLINSWNDCVSKFRCCCGPYCGGTGRRLEDDDGLTERRDEIIRELGGDRGQVQREFEEDRLLARAMKKNPVLAKLIEKAVGQEQRAEELDGDAKDDDNEIVLWEGPQGEISANRPEGVESDSFEDE